MGRGLMLIGVLVTVAILAVLGARAIDGLSSDDALDQVAASVTSTTSAPTSTAPGDQAQVAAADAATCATDRNTLELAAQAYEATGGAPPASQQDLVSGGLLAAPVPNFELALQGGTVVVTGVGVCTGR